MLTRADLERLVPDLSSREDADDALSLGLHLERYRFAAKHVQGRRVLDIACGSGFGTRLLADECADVDEVVGVDISDEAVNYAVQRYQRDGIRFICGDALSYADTSRYDAIVSVETIEHVSDPQTLADNLALHLLRPGGTLVCSAPITPSVDANPYHRSDFTQRTFRRVFLRHGLREVSRMLQVQPFNPIRVLSGNESRTCDIRRNLLFWYARHPASLVRRVWSTVRHGFANHYLFVAWRSMAG